VDGRFLGESLSATDGRGPEQSTPPTDAVEKLWEAGRFEAAARLRAQQVAQMTGPDNSALFGRVVRDDGQALTDEDTQDIGVEPSLIFFSNYWSPQGYFLVDLPPGTYRIVPHGSRWTAETSPVRLEPHTLVDVGVIKLHRRDLSSLPRTKVRLRVGRVRDTQGVTSAAGIHVGADMMDENPFIAVTGEDGTAEIEIPRIPGEWKASSNEPGYAEIWHSFKVGAATESVDLGRFEITRLKQVTIRWVMPKASASNRFARGALVGGTTVLRAYADPCAEDNRVGRSYSFAPGPFDGACAQPFDLELVQSGRGEFLVETEPGVQSTTLLEFFPGTFAMERDDSEAAMCDLGEVPLESIAEIPVGRLRRLTTRGTGLPVLQGHTYALRSFDGQRYVLLHVERVEDQPLDKPSTGPREIADDTDR
jgi:hypothetical protein